MSPGGAIGRGDNSIFVDEFEDSNFQLHVNEYVASTRAAGEWSVVTPEISTGWMTLVSGLLLFLGYRRKRGRPHSS
jgi:hypothetical protein